MAFKTGVKTDKAFKNLLGYAYSEEEKNYWEEGIYWTMPITAEELWLESDRIVYNDPTSTEEANIALKYDKVEMTANSSAFYNGKDRAWAIRETPGNEGSSLITGFIQHVRFGENFRFQLYDNNGSLISVPTMISEGIIFDYANGVVVINEDSNYSFPVPFKITVWKYTGKKATDLSVTRDRIYYDEIPFMQAQYPMNVGTVATQSYRTAQTLYSKWSSYYGPNCKWEIVSDNSGFAVDGLSFSDVNAFVSYCNNNVPNNGVWWDNDFYLKCYDDIDTAVPKIHKVYGMNRMFSAFRGEASYKAGKLIPGGIARYKTAQYSNWQEWENDDENNHWLQQAFNQFGFPFINAPGYMPYIKDVVWLPTNHRTVYGLPRVGSYIYLETDSQWSPYGERKFWDAGQSDCVPALADGYELGSTDGGQAFPMICVFNGAGSSWEWYSYSDASFNKLMVNSTDDGRSMLIVYPIYKQISGDNHYAIFVKPVGMDIFRINYADPNDYDLEVVHRRNDRQQCDVRSATILGSDFRNGHVVDFKTVHISSNASATSVGSSMPSTATFRFRDTNTGYVGHESYAKVKPVVRTRYAPIKWIVSP